MVCAPAGLRPGRFVLLPFTGADSSRSDGTETAQGKPAREGQKKTGSEKVRQAAKSGIRNVLRGTHRRDQTEGKRRIRERATHDRAPQTHSPPPGCDCVVQPTEQVGVEIGWKLRELVESR